MVTADRQALALILSTESVQETHRPLLHVAGLPLAGHALRAVREAASVRRIVLWTSREDEAAVLDDDVEVVRSPWASAWSGVPPRALLLSILERIGAITEDVVVVLPSRTPLRPVGSVQAAVAAFQPDVVQALTVVFHEKGNLGRLSGDLLQLLGKDLKQRQDLEPVYADAGSIYVTSAAAIWMRRHLLDGKIQGLLLDPQVGYEVNDELDACVAERWLQVDCRI